MNAVSIRNPDVFMLRKSFLAACVLLMLMVFASSVHAYQYYWSKLTRDDGLSGNAVRTVSMDPGGYLWLGVREQDGVPGVGIDVVDRMYEVVSYDSADGLGNNNVNAIAFEHIDHLRYDDSDCGTVWMGTEHGISVLDRKGTFTNITPGNSPLPGNTVTTVYIDRENTKWISVWGNGICCVDAEFNWHIYTRADGLCSNRILSITEDKNGNMWFGSYDNGVSRLDPDGNWMQFSSEQSGLIGNRVRAIACEAPNKLWFVTTNGLSVFNGQNWTSYSSRNSPIGNFVPTAIVIDRFGNKWIGTERGGLFKLDGFGIWSSFQKHTSSLLDNRINSLLIDGPGTVWIATPAGLCSVGPFPGKRGRPVSRDDFVEPTDQALGKGVYYPFESAVVWKKSDISGLQPELSFALPTFFRGGRSWMYAAFWADKKFAFKDLGYTITGDRTGRLRISFNGAFSRARFLAVGGVLSAYRDAAIDRQMGYPFPRSFPGELRMFLSSGTHIPSNNPDIKSLAESLVQQASRDDMWRTMKDIIYSQFLQNISLDTAAGTTHDALSLIKNKKGSATAKVRLVCSLARAVGVPAKIVMGIEGSVWCELWLAGLGWVPVEASYPVYDYIRPVRTSMPKALSSGEHAIASVSGTDDDAARVTWNPALNASWGETSPELLRDYKQMSAAKILLIKITESEPVPENARVRIADDIFVTALQQDGDVWLVFQDRTGTQLKRMPLHFSGLSLFTRIQRRLFWKFLPRRIGDMLIIENIECVAAEPAEADTKNSSPSKDFTLTQTPAR